MFRKYLSCAQCFNAVATTMILNTIPMLDELLRLNQLIKKTFVVAKTLLYV